MSDSLPASVLSWDRPTRRGGAPVGYNRPMMKEPSPQAGPGIAPTAAAVVLAAGRSSRMGASKPLLRLGQSSAIERVVSSLRQAGVEQIVVVTGHDPGPLLPVLDTLEVDRAHNAGYDSGMFSSVQTGLAALRDGIDAFFVLPVDCPLVTPHVLALLLERSGRSFERVLYPVCCRHRGHPPLLSADCVRPLLEADNAGSLEAFLAVFGDAGREVDVRDITVLLDMDTPDAYAVLNHLALILDGALDALTNEDALFLLAAAGTPANVVAHCRAVAAVGERIAEAVKPHLPALDVALVRTGCLLHDIARLEPDHAIVAQELLTHLGLPRLGAVVGRHMVIGPGLPGTSDITEAELVYLADKLVADDRLVGLDAREARAFRKKRPGPEAAARLRARMRDARMMADKVTAYTGRPLEEILEGPSGHGSAVMRVCLVRHAEPEGPAGRRFLGQADPDLGVGGEAQARRLAQQLRALTGGAGFDAVWSSDLRRSLRTAEIAGGPGGPEVRAEPWLREIDVGLWEGLTWEEARGRYPAEHDRRERDIVGHPFPGGESFADLQARVVPAFRDLISRGLAAGHRRVLVVGHIGVNRVILAHFLGLPLKEIFSIAQEYCALTELEVSGWPSEGLRVVVAGSQGAAGPRCVDGPESAKGGGGPTPELR